MLLDDRRQLERGTKVFRRTVCDGNDQNPRFTLMSMGGENNGTGSVFRALLATVPMFTQPQIRIPNDQPGFRLWQTHGIQSLRSASRC